MKTADFAPTAAAWCSALTMNCDSASCRSRWKMCSTPPDTAAISVIPIARDGTKAPDASLLPREWDEDTAQHKATWKPFQREAATEAQARQWWGGQRPPGIGAVCGAVLGGLEVIDFDRQADEFFPAWRALVEEEAPGLVARLTVVRTPRPG